MGPWGKSAPAISGNIVVWADYRNSSTTGTDIYAKDLSTGREFPVCTAPGNQDSSAISGNIVVWVDERNWDTTGWDIYGYRLDSYGGPPTTLPDQPWLPDWPVAGPVYHYATQTHAHYRAEGGLRGLDMTPNQLALRYRGHGYAFTAATEHYPQYRDYTDMDFWDRTGAEAVGRIGDSFEDTSNTHILGIGFLHDHMDMTYAGQAGHEVERVSDITGGTKGSGLAIAAHPNDYSYPWQDWVLRNCALNASLTGVEIFNAGTYWLWPWRAYATDKWDSLLALNKPIWGFAGDDFTRPWPQEDGACVVVVSPSRSPTTLTAWAALKRGAFYASKGPCLAGTGAWHNGNGAPIIEGWWADAQTNTVNVVTSAQCDRVVFVTGSGARVAVVPWLRPDGKYEASYTYAAGDKYVRAEVYRGQFWPWVSWTQPIFIGRQGTQTFMWAPQAAATRALEPIVIDFDQAHLEISQPQSALAGTVYAYLLPPSDRPPSAPPLGYVGSCYRFLPAAELEGTNILRLGYDPQEVTLVPEALLAIYWFDPDQEAWVELPSTVDETAHTVTAAITHLGTFAVSAPMPEEANAPGVTILSPTSGTTLAGVQTITADAWDDNGVASVQFYLGNLPLGTDLVGADGWSADLDCSRYPPGVYTLAAVASDAAGNEGRAEVQVTLTGGAPAPTLTINSPVAGASVAGVLQAAGTWWDDEAPLKVIAMLGEVPLGVPVLAQDGTWSLNAVVVGVPAGSHALVIAGEDAAGNPVSATVQVTVIAPGTLIGQVRVRGTTTNIAGATVKAYLSGELMGAATTGPNGIYTIPDLPPGQYVVAASKQGYLTQTKAKIAVTSGQTSYVNFNLEVSGRLTGQVRERGTSNDLVGATVTAYLGGKAQASATTGQYGVYVIDADLPAGTYTVSAAMAGYVTQTKGPIAVTAGATSYVNFGLERTPSIKGQVREAGTGTPIAGATVSINSWGLLTVVVTATSDANGIYAFPPGLPSGTYTLWASKAGYVTQTKANISTIEGEPRYVNFNLQVSGKLKGQVRDRVTGAPIIGATVIARSGGILRATVTTTAPWGIYEIDRDLPGGTYCMNASAAGYIDQGKTGIVVTPGATTYVNFNLQPAAQIRARIQGPPDDNLSASMSLKFYPPGGSGAPLQTQTVPLDKYGRAVMGLSVPAGTYDVWGKVATHLAKRVPGWTCAPGSSEPLDFGTLLAGDLVNDNVVNQADADYMTSVWFSSDPVADINRDGVVNTADYSFIISNWGKAGDW